MAELINLRRARKAKARTQAEASADANRVEFGRTKSEKKLTKAENDVAHRRLDGHKRKPESARDDD
jgi:hypothetical protein